MKNLFDNTCKFWEEREVGIVKETDCQLSTLSTPSQSRYPRTTMCALGFLKYCWLGSHTIESLSLIPFDPTHSDESLVWPASLHFTEI